MRRGVGAAKREVLGLVGLDSVEEGGVVGGLAGGDLAVEKVDVAGRRDHAALGVIAGNERGVVAVDHRAGRDLDAGARREPQRDPSIDVERCTKLDRRCGSAIRCFLR